MTHPDLYAVSDGLRDLKKLFDLHSTCVLNEEGLDMVRGSIERLRQMALELEHEKSRGLWNAAARAERYQRDEDQLVIDADLINLVCDEVERPGSNVTLFPVIRRPVFQGSQPKGGA